MSLFAKTVLLTRPREQSEQIRPLFEKLGANVLIQPTIEILPPENWASVDEAIRAIDSFDWMIFSSANGVRSFLSRFMFLARRSQSDDSNDARAFGSISDNREFELSADRFDSKAAIRSDSDSTDRFGSEAARQTIEFWRDKAVSIAAIGPGTAAAVREFGLTVRLVPSEYSAEGMVAALKEFGIASQKILSVRANRGRDVLSTELTKLGATVQEIVAYRSVDRTTPNPSIVHALNEGRIDAIVLTSSAIAKSLIRTFGDSLRKSRLVSISPLTSQTIRENGFEAALEAERADVEGIVDLLQKKL